MTTYDTIILFAEYERQKGRETMKTTPIELSFATTTRRPIRQPHIIFAQNNVSASKAS